MKTIIRIYDTSYGEAHLSAPLGEHLARLRKKAAGDLRRRENKVAQRKLDDFGECVGGIMEARYEASGIMDEIYL